MWPQRWLGELYSRLWTSHRGGLFNLSDVVSLVGSEAKARVAVSRLKKMGLLYVFSSIERRKQYAIGTPTLLPYLASGKLLNLDLIKQGRYARLIALFSIEALRLFSNIKSIVVYGSVSRGDAAKESDVDLLVLIEDERSVGERIQKLSRLEDLGAIREELEWLDSQGIFTHISILPFTEREALQFPPILLDIVEEGIPVADDGTFLELRDRLRARLMEAGAKREFLSPTEWYWDLAPGLRLGEVYAL